MHDGYGGASFFHQIIPPYSVTQITANAVHIAECSKRRKPRNTKIGTTRAAKNVGLRIICLTLVRWAYNCKEGIMKYQLAKFCLVPP